MRNVQTVAANTFREAVRDRGLYNLVWRWFRKRWTSERFTPCWPNR